MDGQEEDTGHDETITHFIGITGAEEEIAKSLLEACNWNVEMAINMYVDSNMSAPSRTVATNNTEPPKTESSVPSESDEIRPPIPPVRQVLVEDYHGPQFASYRRNFDNFRNFEQEARWQEQQMMDEQNSSSSNEGAATSAGASSRKTFEDLFRPPLDLIFRGNFEMAKFEGQRQNKWLMINIQNPQEFACQVLNRDVWSNHAVKSIINEHFIFWQNYNNNSEGQKYVTFYNVATFPYVSIVDPRTGEKMVSWSEIDTMTFCDNITQFLSEHPSPGITDAQPSTAPNFLNFEDKTIYEESEDMQLKAAIQASLQDAQSGKESMDADSSEDDADEEFSSPATNHVKEDWKDYLGSDEDSKMEIVIRYPDGNRENAIFPSTSKMKALFLYVAEKGFSMNEYDLITNFPKKSLSTHSDDDTLEKVGLHSRDTLYLQVKH